MQPSRFTLKMAALYSSKMLTPAYQTAWCHNSGDHNMNLHLVQTPNLKTTFADSCTGSSVKAVQFPLVLASRFSQQWLWRVFTLFWDVLPCSPAEDHRHFRWLYDLHLQSQKPSKQIASRALLSTCFLLGLLFSPTMQAEKSSEISVDFYRATWHYIPEDSTLLSLYSFPQKDKQNLYFQWQMIIYKASVPLDFAPSYSSFFLFFSLCSNWWMLLLLQFSFVTILIFSPRQFHCII
jgi:hypothetical protein